jgi:hypothetical protein
MLGYDSSSHLSMMSVAYDHMLVGDMCSENMFNTHLRASLPDNPHTGTSPIHSAASEISQPRRETHVLQAEVCVGLRTVPSDGYGSTVYRPSSPINTPLTATGTAVIR